VFHTADTGASASQPTVYLRGTRATWGYWGVLAPAYFVLKLLVCPKEWNFQALATNLLFFALHTHASLFQSGHIALIRKAVLKKSLWAP